ncbi:MAG: hypothetical protein LLG04_18720 [Parachlamydia sp.]|nr:hypothetical protein [Parachlamydia sp.]
MRLCHGLEHVEWTDELELCIQLQQIELKNQGLVVEIRESLANITLPPFPVSLQGLQVDKRKKGRGTLWVRVSETPELTRLCKELGRNLKNLELIIHEMPPQIVLGKFQTLSPERLANYLEAHAAFSLPLFEASTFALAEYHQTPKRSVFTPIQKFSLR